MRTKYLLAGIAASTLLATAALAQSSPPPAPAPAATATKTAPVQVSGQWRASKLIGLNVYNNNNEKIGDINEILVTSDGKISGVVIGAGGFLGMGEHDVLVKLDQIKFVNEPVRTSATTTTTTTPTTTTRPAPAPTTGSGSATVPARPARAANEKWYPDHAIDERHQGSAQGDAAVQVQLTIRKSETQSPGVSRGFRTGMIGCCARANDRHGRTSHSPDKSPTARASCRGLRCDAWAGLLSLCLTCNVVMLLFRLGPAKEPACRPPVGMPRMADRRWFRRPGIS